MSKYVWTAKDKSGQKVVQEVEAETAEDSRATLVDAGYTELVLKVDEIMAAVQAGFPSTFRVLGEEVRVTTEQMLQHLDNPTVTSWGAIRQGIGQSKLMCVLLALFAAYSGYREHWGSALLLMIALLAWLTFIVCVSLPSAYYRKLILASDWYRWSEVLSLISTLESIGRFSFIKVPATELTRNRAQALAGMGRLDEALAEYKQCAGRPDCPTWLYRQFVGSLYTIAKQYDKGIESSLLSIAEKPTPTAWADLANRYARYKRDPVKAREAMAEADKHPTVEQVKPFRIRCLGIIAYLEGDYLTAKRHLETAIDMVEKAKGRPYRDGHLSVARAYLCCVLARLGDFQAARDCLALAREYLVATEETDLLAECCKLLGK